MLIGYARVSTQDQNLDLQRDAPQRAGCEKIFEEKKSGKAGTKRSALEAAFAYLRPEDFLVVWKLDRLGRSFVEMMRTIDQLRQDGVKFRSLTEHSTAKPPTAASLFRCTAPWQNIFSTSTGSAPWRA